MRIGRFRLDALNQLAILRPSNNWSWWTSSRASELYNCSDSGCHVLRLDDELRSGMQENSSRRSGSWHAPVRDGGVQRFILNILPWQKRWVIIRGISSVNHVLCLLWLSIVVAFNPNWGRTIRLLWNKSINLDFHFLKLTVNNKLSCSNLLSGIRLSNTMIETVITGNNISDSQCRSK